MPAHLLAGKLDINRDAYNSAPVGLGPYKFAAWDRGSRIVLVADPHYVRGAPAIPALLSAFVFASVGLKQLATYSNCSSNA